MLAPNNEIRLSSAYHYLRALERRRSLNGLAALTLLLRLSLEHGEQQLAMVYTSSLLRVLLVQGLDLIGHGVAEMVFGLYEERLFRKVRWDGLRFDLADYPYTLLSVKLHALVEDRLMRAQLAGGRESHSDITTAILAGHYAQHFRPQIEPVVAPDLDIAPPTAESMRRWHAHKGESNT